MNARPFIDRQKRSTATESFSRKTSVRSLPMKLRLRNFSRSQKEEAVSKGYVWADEDKFKRKYTQTISASDLPDSIEETPDSILKRLSAVLIVGPFIKLFRKNLIFIVQTNYHCRARAWNADIERIMMRNPPRLWRRICQCAGIHLFKQRLSKHGVAHTHGDAPCVNRI